MCAILMDIKAGEKKKNHAALVITDLKDGGHKTPAEAPTSQSLHATYCFFLISGREIHLTRAIAPLPYSGGLKCNYVTRLTT